MLANYTWARGTDTSQVGGASGTFFGGDVPLDPNNIRAENGPSDTDIRNRFTMSFVYQPMLFQGHKVLKQVVDGFTFSGIEIASGGQPIYLGMSGTVYSGAGTSYGADGNIYGGAMSSGSGTATTGRPPQIGRNSIYGPGFNDFDFCIARNVPIHGKMYMQVTADAFNLLNHTIVTSVNSTYSQYTGASTSATSACSTGAGSATASTVHPDRFCKVASRPTAVRGCRPSALSQEPIPVSTRRVSCKSLPSSSSKSPVRRRYSMAGI